MVAVRTTSCARHQLLDTYPVGLCPEALMPTMPSMPSDFTGSATVVRKGLNSTVVGVVIKNGCSADAGGQITCHSGALRTCVFMQLFVSTPVYGVHTNTFACSLARLSGTWVRT